MSGSMETYYTMLGKVMMEMETAHTDVKQMEEERGEAREEWEMRLATVEGELESNKETENTVFGKMEMFQKLVVENEKEWDAWWRWYQTTGEKAL